ncbi:hypothetical protein DQ237_10245 [Blastococcus sp. TF02-8]|uniref:hypothetical protein n=1 Tax=Blastococcus sp. TF02-8 TaxID=2250574 RepID=UPI000DEA157C|nr:hypothetical protein [Blastococcus sp. TF02-8]RBY96233.1 hypothetical protein DQ237_10245 [Blastococcus sp. TF02-8]
MDIRAANQRIDLALKAQGYRRVAVQALAAPADIDLRRVPADLAQALRSAPTTTSWSGLAEQMAVLRDGLDIDGAFLQGLYLGVEKQALRLVVVTGYAGSPLGMSLFRRKFDFAWSTLQSMERFVQTFQLDSKVLALLDAARKKYVTVTDPVAKAAVDLVWALISTARASGGPQGVFLAACTTGLTQELATALRGFAFHPGQTGLGAQPVLEGVAWDCRAPAFRADDLYYTMLDVVDDHRLKQGLAV